MYLLIFLMVHQNFITSSQRASFRFHLQKKSLLLEKLQALILELQAQLSDVAIQKEKITSLANGKAGNVYIISNLGSFGDKMFKIVMTRRLEPQERID